MTHLISPNSQNRSHHGSESKSLAPLHDHPHLASLLLPGCKAGLNQVTDLISPLLDNPARGSVADRYIQAITTGYTTFLATNLVDEAAVHITMPASSWMIGRNPDCTIVVSEPSVSRRHAVIGFSVTEGFYVVDIGSANGTRVNRRKLLLSERVSLQDGDLLELGNLKIEFFSVLNGLELAGDEDITRH